MRYGADHKQKSRERVVAAAAEAIRAQGTAGVSVGGVMSAAGLTHGAFYAHFESRDALVAAGVERMFEEGRARLELNHAESATPAEALRNYIDFYLSPAHRDTRVTGCPLPYLASEAPRLSGEIRERYARGAASLERALAETLSAYGHPDPQTTATGVLAELVGALSIARAEPDPTRSDEILERCRRSLRARLKLADC